MSKLFRPRDLPSPYLHFPLYCPEEITSLGLATASFVVGFARRHLGCSLGDWKRFAEPFAGLIHHLYVAALQRVRLRQRPNRSFLVAQHGMIGDEGVRLQVNRCYQRLDAGQKRHA